MLTLNDGRSELWQWDTGRKLTVDADCSQVHFSNKIFGRSIDVDVVDGVAIIPDVLLQTDKELIAWAFVGTAENGYTKISKVFKVNKRNKPADYMFTPPEQTTLAELVDRLDAIEESQDPDAIKNAVDEYLQQNPIDSPVDSVNGKTGKVELTAEDVGAISQDELQEATNEALAKAKASGLFDGPAGADGPQGPQGIPGDDYVLTHDDKNEIAEMAAELVEVPEGESVEVDPTLTKEGSAADAKAVGEELGKKIAAPSTALIGQTVAVKAVDENGKPTEWEATDLPDGFGGSWNDLTDKPFGESVEEVEVIAETVANEACNLWYKDSQSIKEGLTYAVYHNGERYECVAMLNKYGYPTLEAEPFKIADDSGGAYAFIVFTEKNVTHTISVFAISQTTALLPEKYIPNTIARTTDIPAAVTDDHINSLIDAKLGVIENGTY